MRNTKTHRDTQRHTESREDMEDTQIHAMTHRNT